MERKKYIILSFVLLLFPTFVWSAKNYKEEIYKAYIDGDMERWKLLLEDMDAQASVLTVSIEDMINYQYGYIGWCVGVGRKTEAKRWLDKLEPLLESLEKQQTRPALVGAYRAAVIGFKIGLDTYKAPFIGPKSIEYAKRAMRLDSGEAMGFIQYGNILFFTPSMFGGDKPGAIAYYKEAVAKMEAKALQTQKNWNYLSLLAVLATAYYETGDREKALLVLEKCLNVEPNFKWIKNELYPHYKNKK